MKAWIARDSDGCLWMYRTHKPKVNKHGFFIPYGDYIEMHNDWFPEVTFENSPQEVEIKLVMEE